MVTAVRVLVAEVADWPVVATGRPPSEPVVVVSANRVIAASPGARAEGIGVGLRRREAQGRCPDVEVVAADPGRDARAWEPVVAAVEAFTPGVEVVRPGVVALATRGPSRYFGGDQALGTRVVAAVDAVAGLGGCRVGVADGRLAAHLAARGTGAHLAAGEADGAGDPVRVVAPRGSRAFLAPWPVATLERPDLADLLERLGLRTLGDLAALPAPAVLARFGPDGALAHRLSRGLDSHPLALRTPPPNLAVETELDPPAERVDTVAFVGKALADELHARLGERGLACTRVAIEASTEHGENLVRRWRHDGALTAAAIAERVRWQLDGWLGSGHTTAGITLLRLVPEEVAPDHGRQLGLWGGSAVCDERVARSLARLQGLLGPEAVVTAVLGGGRDPRSQVRLVPWGDPRQPPRSKDPRPAGAGGQGTRRAETAKGARQTGAGHSGMLPPRASGPDRAPWPGRLPGPAPAAVHPTPIPAEVLDAGGAPLEVTGRGVASGVPVSLSVAGGPWLEISSWAGPWPVEEQWWEQRGRRRARFQLGLAGGMTHLVAREGGRWWVEATYD
ncbi:MAG TPA: DNA polymerase Y family protein [Acidimicrobiales bacterium]|nr:DNA polymerase Y family protein [Acidimicrobiales bacterium]